MGTDREQAARFVGRHEARSVWKPPNGESRGVYVARFLFGNGAGDQMVLTKIGSSHAVESRLATIAKSKTFGHRGAHGHFFARGGEAYCERLESFYVIHCESQAVARAVETAMHLLVEGANLWGDWHALSQQTFEDFRGVTAPEVMALAAGSFWKSE